MAHAWYYADRHHQQQGPVDATWFPDAVRRGDVTPQTLVWRAGLTNWVALAQVAGEVGLVARPPAPRAPTPTPRPAGAATYTARDVTPPSPAPTPHVARPAAPSPSATPAAGGYARPASAGSAGVAARTPTVQDANRTRIVVTKSGGFPGWAIFLLIAIAAVPVIGIIAAIAIPAYSDYTTRAHVAAAFATAEAMKGPVFEFREGQGRCPRNGDGGFGETYTYAAANLDSILLGDDEAGGCMIRLFHTNIPGTSGENVASTLTLPKGETRWTVSSALPPRYLPARYRDASTRN